MAEQVLVQVRVDKKLKEEVSEIYEMLGLDLPTAIRMFLVRSKLERGLPLIRCCPKQPSPARKHWMLWTHCSSRRRARRT